MKNYLKVLATHIDVLTACQQQVNSAVALTGDSNAAKRMQKEAKRIAKAKKASVEKVMTFINSRVAYGVSLESAIKEAEA